MKLTALATMKIEGDIVEEFVRHTLRFVDQVIVVDNESLDGAREILTELASEGLPLIVWDGEAFPSAATGWTTLARRAFATFDTDYLLMLDVDEFVRAPGRSTLERELEALRGAHALVPWVTYVPTPDDYAAEPRILARTRYRLTRESYPFSKVFVHRSFAEDPGAAIAPGSHTVFSSLGRVVSSDLPGIELAHIPVRTLRQIQSKALIGWPTIVAMGLNDDRRTAYQWRRLHEHLLAGKNWNADDVFRLAWHYLDEEKDRPELLLDPLSPVERRYLREPPELLTLAMKFINQLAHISATSTAHLSRNVQRITSINNNVHVGNHDSKAIPSAEAEPPETGLTRELQRAAAAVAAAHEAQRRAEAQVADEVQARKRADAQASLQAKLRSDALARLAAETLRYQTDLDALQNQLRELHQLVQAMQRSSSWRLTLPFRIAGILLRKRLNGFRRRTDGRVVSRALGVVAERRP